MDYEKNERMGPLTPLTPMTETGGSGRAREFGQILGQMAPQTMPATERIALHNVDEAFTYQPWDGQQQDAGAQVREALVAAARRSAPAAGRRRSSPARRSSACSAARCAHGAPRVLVRRRSRRSGPSRTRS